MFVQLLLNFNAFDGHGYMKYDLVSCKGFLKVGFMQYLQHEAKPILQMGDVGGVPRRFSRSPNGSGELPLSLKIQSSLNAML